MRPLRLTGMAGGCLALLGLLAPAWAQAHNPFGVGISEGGGNASGALGWILSQQGAFERSIATAVRASKADGSALWVLMGLSLLYGILHAAGPGHGKAVLASYMIANKQALKRGILLSFLAALLQAAVAIAMVSVLSLLFHATAIGMRDTATIIEKLSYVGIAMLGAVMVWRKGRSLASEWRRRRTAIGPGFKLSAGSPDASLAYAGAAFSIGAAAQPRLSAFVCEAAHEHSATCGHVHAADPRTFGVDFSWREALWTVAAAGARPCSGAILVLVFGLAQGKFLAGVASTLVMALGTAMTTAALASIAVLAKSVALRLAGPGGRNGALIGRVVEFSAAALVLAVGLSLLFGVGPLQGLA